MDTKPVIVPNSTASNTLMIRSEHFLILIDDNEWENQFMRVMLHQLPGIKDFRILSSVWNALIYLDLCKTKNAFPDLILVDLHMKEIGGFEFIELFEKNYAGDHPDCKLFILTNSEDSDDRNKAAQYPSVRAFINKPLTPEKFDASIKPYLT